MLQVSNLSTNPLYQLASESRRSGFLVMAIQVYRQLIPEIDSTNKLALSIVLLELGTACLDLDQPKPAISVLHNAQGVAHDALLPKREAECFTALGQAYRKTQQLPAAFRCFQQAHPLLAELEPDAAHVRLWNQQGITHNQCAAYASAYEDYVQALALARAIHNQQLEAEVLLNLGGLCVGNLEKREQGIAYLEAALAILRTREDSRNNALTVAQILTLLASVKMQRQETMPEVSTLLTEAEQFAHLSLDQALIARVSYLMGAASLMQIKYKYGEDELAFRDDQPR